MQVLTAATALVHAGAAALWLGAMAYSLFVVQPRLARMLGDPGAGGGAGDPGGAGAGGGLARLEDEQRELARGNRWPVVGMITLLWVTGIGLVAGNADGATGWWWAGVGVKAVLLAAATGLFWWVSWRAWPRRIFALPDELAGLQRRFRGVAVALLALVGAAFATGVLL